MFGSLGFSEIAVIAAIALVVMGPEKFPEFVKIVLRTVRDLRGYVTEMRDEISKEINPMKKELKKFSNYDPEAYIDKLMAEEDQSSTTDEPHPDESFNKTMQGKTASLDEEQDEVLEGTEYGSYDEADARTQAEAPEDDGYPPDRAVKEQKNASDPYSLDG